jgi:hypothetical protein
MIVGLFADEDADVPVFSAVKTPVDLFRNGRIVDRSVAVEGLRSALDQRKATSAQIADAARADGAWRVMRPHLEVLTVPKISLHRLESRGYQIA